MPGGPLPSVHHMDMGRLRKLTEASTIVGATSSLDTLLQVTAEQARLLAKAHLSVVSVNADQAYVPHHRALSRSEGYTAWPDEIDPHEVLGDLARAASQPIRLTRAKLQAHPVWRARAGPALTVCGWLAVPLLNHDGQAVGVIQLFDKQENEFTDVDELLVHQLAVVAMLALQNARLHTKAEQVMLSRDQFLSMAAHDLKTPLTSLRGFSQMLLRQLDKGEPFEPERLRRSLQAIDQQTERVAQLMNDLREISRIDSGRITLELKAADLGALAESVVVALEMSARSCPMTVHATDSVLVQVDPLRWRQALTYLLDFVASAHRSQVPLEVEVSKPDTGTAQLAIADPEDSTPPDDWRQLFERLQQATSPASLRGIKLGLYVAYRLIQLHGGQCYVEFPSETGVRIVVTLPTTLKV